MRASLIHSHSLCASFSPGPSFSTVTCTLWPNADLVCLAWSPRFCISNKLPGGAQAAGARASLESHVRSSVEAERERKKKNPISLNAEQELGSSFKAWEGERTDGIMPILQLGKSRVGEKT